MAQWVEMLFEILPIEVQNWGFLADAFVSGSMGGGGGGGFIHHTKW